MRLHESFKEFDPGVLEAARKFFDSQPWEGDDDLRLMKFQSFWDRACNAINAPTNQIAVLQEVLLVDALQPDTMLIGSLHVTSLFHAFFHKMKDHYGIAALHDDCAAGTAWAYSLFYRVRPETFKRSVAKGKIPGVDVMDLIELDDVNCALTPEQENAFDALADQIIDSLDDETDKELIELMDKFI